MKYFLSFCLFLGLIAALPAQVENPAGEKNEEKPLVEKPLDAVYFLSLEKGGRVKRIRFYEGDQITFSFKGTREKQTALITKITADRLELINTPVDINKIGRITLYNRNGLRAAGAGLLPAAGVLYFLGDMINPVFSGHDMFRVKTGSIVVPAVLIGSGLLLHAFRKRTLKMNKNRYLRILEKI